MSDPRDHPVLANLLTLPLLPHEIALIASILTIAARGVGKLFGQNNNLAATTAALAATTILVGARYMWRAIKLDNLNHSRNHERTEAAAQLGALLHDNAAEKPNLDRRLNTRIKKVLLENSESFLQSPLAGSAAALALSGVTDVHELRRVASQHTQGLS